jgi:Xaa-Pro aminopeptidase
MSFDPEVYRARRARVFEAMERAGGGTLLLPAADERPRNADNVYPFRQDSDYAWSVGLDEPTGCALFLARRGERKLILFVRPRDKEREIWNGARAGVAGARETYLAHEAFLVSEMDAKLPELLDGTRTLWFRIGWDAAWDARLARILVELRSSGRTGKRPPEAVVDAGRIVHEARLVKSPDEIALLHRAAEITAEGHLAAMRDGIDSRREYRSSDLIEYAFRRRGGSPGFETIVAAGPSSTVLHYRAGDGVLRDGEVCLVDAGGEYQWYTADVSRTFPVSGEFTSAQRELYALCLAAEKEAVAAVRPGTTLEAIHDGVVRRITDGLIGLGLLQGTADARIADRSFRKYYMHRTSHWLGMDVHDVGDYHAEEGKPRVLVPGMVLTIEPGIYVPADDEAAPAAMRGVGIRIEDDVLVAEDGPVNLTQAIPKEIAEVEAACAR